MHRIPALVGLNAVLSLGLTAAVAQPTTSPASTPLVRRDLEGYRQEHPSHLIVHGPSPKSWQDPTPLKPPPGVTDIVFPSGDLKLHAWESAVPADNQPHPAVVFCHGGFWFGNEDWDSAEPFLKAGYVVMMPRVRGENDNPGEFGFYLDEVDDVIAAGRFLAGQRGIDPKRVFVSGHSAGGSLAAFAVMKDTPFAMAAPIGADLNIVGDTSRWDQRHRDLLVFDPTNLEELRIRSAAFFSASLRAPIALFQGDHDGTGLPQKNFVANAHRFQHSATVTFVPGDHFESLAAALPGVIKAFDHYAPGRHVEAPIPMGWVVTRTGANDGTAFLAIRNDAKKLYIAGHATPKAMFPGDTDLDKFGQYQRRVMVAKATEANVTAVTPVAGRATPTLEFTSNLTTPAGAAVKNLTWCVELPDYFVSLQLIAPAGSFPSGPADLPKIADGTKQTDVGAFKGFLP